MSLTDPLYEMPAKGLPDKDVRNMVDDLFDGMTQEEKGKFASTAFWGVEETNPIVKETFMKFFSWNALFTFQEASAAKLENDVLDICIGLMGGDENSRANLTSGGTESNFCGLHAMRKWSRERYPDVSEPEIVTPYSTHSTVHKACKILDIKVVTVPQLEDLSADLEGMKQAIGPNTIGIVASAPNWPYGQVDPITELGEFCEEKDLWLHVDACVGGYILPFFKELGEEIPPYNLSVPGVRSITGDLHKYGFAPKPCSTVLWRSKEEQKYHFMPIDEWACGTYLSQGFVGSRPLAPVAATWALMHSLGKDGYLDNARRILAVRDKVIAGVNAIEGLKTWKTDGPLIQIASDDFAIELIVGGMTGRGWKLLGVNTPPAIHITIDALSEPSLNLFLDDLKDVAKDVRSGNLTEEGLLVYGGAGDKATAPKWLLSALDIMENSE